MGRDLEPLHSQERNGRKAFADAPPLFSARVPGEVPSF